MSETGAGRPRGDLPPGNGQPESAGQAGTPGARAAGDEASARASAGQAHSGPAGHAAEAQLADLRSRLADAEDLRLRALADLDNLRTGAGQSPQSSRQLASNDTPPEATFNSAGVKQTRHRPEITRHNDAGH
jgi:hypothetical protein